MQIKVIRCSLSTWNPQASLTAAMVGPEQLEGLWSPGKPLTIHGAISPLMTGAGDIAVPHLEAIAAKLDLVVGDPAISQLEDELATAWANCLDRKERAFRVTLAFHGCIQRAAEAAGAEVALVNVGVNLGAINRAALAACRYIVVPVAPDLFSLQALRSLGPTVRQWREEWKERIPKNPVVALELPDEAMEPAGYVVRQHSIRLDRPLQAYALWMSRTPELYATAVLGEPTTITIPRDLDFEDPTCRSLDLE